MSTDNNGMYMPVAPAYANNGGFGFGGDNAWWIIILLIFMGGWGNGWNGNGGNGIGSEVQRGFDQATLTNGISGITNGMNSGFTGVQTALCSGFAGVNAGIANGFAQAEIAANSRQMADMNQQFALQSALQQCCCDNRAATADLKYTVATEACADRNAVSSALQQVIAANNASTQRILDQMCNDKIDAKNETIAQLRQQLQMAELASTQNAQTAQILANNEAQTAALERYLAPTPIPAYMVQNPNCCGWQNTGCGCGAA